ncbi:MAG: tRNA (adenosine(37)-N6)-threonylcarbamoyltransferase complex ATPase subunit type 1 TsaE [Dehalococcoidales bacterium]
MQEYTVLSNSAAATLSLGKRIGKELGAGSIIALTGELGCGKTLLTRGICAGLGVPLRQVNSPTFIFVNEYTGRLPVFHMDLYLTGLEANALDSGLADYLHRAKEGVMIIEWAERIAAILPGDCLAIGFEVISVKKRRLEFTAATDKFRGLFEELKKQ